MSIQRAFLPRKKRHLRGFALIFVLAFAAIIVVFSAVAGSQASFNLKLVSNRGQSDRAYYAATTGTHLILSMLREPPPADPDPWLSHDSSLEWPMSNNTDMFAKVFHNLEGFDHATPEAPDLTKIPPGCFYIVSLGVVNGRFEGGEIVGGVRYEQTTMGTTLRPSYPLLPHAAYAYDRLTIEDAIVDHFDSRNGSAPWQSSHYSTSASVQARPEASVATELKELGSPNAIQVTGTSAKIYGNVLMGSGTSDADLTALASSLPGTPPRATDTPDTRARPFGVPGTGSSGVETRAIVGRVDVLTSTKIPPDMNYSADRVEMLTGSLPATLAEGKIYLRPNDLDVSGVLNVVDTNGDGKIEDTIVLVERNITFRSGSQINRNSPPRQLKFYSLDTAGSGTTFIAQSGSKDNFCLVSGANLDVTLESDSELWGAVFGKRVFLKPTSQLHYDVVLRDPTILADTYDFQLSSSVVSPGASVNPGDLRASGAATGGTSGGTSGGTVGGTGGGTVGGGCGCGCGGGSMLMMEKQMEMQAL